MLDQTQKTLRTTWEEEEEEEERRRKKHFCWGVTNHESLQPSLLQICISSIRALPHAQN